MGQLVKIGEATAPRSFQTAATITPPNASEKTETGQVIQSTSGKGKLVKIGEATAPKSFQTETQATQPTTSVGSTEKVKTVAQLEGELEELQKQYKLAQQKKVGAQRAHTSQLLEDAETEIADLAERISAVNKELEDLGGSEKEATWGDVVKNAAYTGLGQFNKGLFSTLDFILPTEFLGKYDFVSNLNDYYSDKYDNYSQKLAESTADKGKVGQVAGKLMSGTVAAVPNALLALMSGGASAAAQGTTAGLQAASTAASSSGILSTASAAAQQLAKNPLYWSSVAQTLGTDYEEAKESGASEAEAIGTAFISSLLNAGVEVGGGLETLPSALQSGSKSAIREWVKSALEEGQEEVVQGVISNLTQKALYDQDKEYFSTTDENAVVNPSRMAQEFGMGAAIGGILGGAQTAVGSALNSVFLPGSGLDTPVQTQQTVQDTPTPPTQPATAPNAVTQTQDTTAQNAAPGAIQTQKNTAPIVETVENAAGVTPAESETNAVSQLRPNGSGTTVSPEPIVPTTQEKVNSIISDQLKQGKGYASLTELIHQISAAIPEDVSGASQVFSDLISDGTYGVNAAGQLYQKNADSHIDNRDIATVGNRNVKSFQFENPTLHSYFVEAAQALKSDLANTTKGERFYAAANMDTSDSMEGKWSGVKRNTTEGIATLKDDWHLSYADIEKAADAIINDKGQENYAAAKRVEIILDDMLSHGYTDPTGFPVPPNQEYVQAKAAIKGSNPTTGTEANDPLPLYDVEERSAPPTDVERQAAPMDDSVDGFGQNTVGAAQARFKYREAPTQSVGDNLFTEQEMQEHPELQNKHQVLTDAEGNYIAEEMLANEYDDEVERLQNEEWGKVENIEGHMILEDLVAKARESGSAEDWAKVTEWKKLYDQKGGTEHSQALQGRAQFADSPADIVAEAAETLNGENIRKMSDEKKNKILNDVHTQAAAYDSIQEGDTASLISLIERNNEIRRTTGLFSKKTAKLMDWALNKVVELYPETAENFLRDVAQSQIRSIASDYQKLSPLEAIKNYRVMGILSKASTVMRNLVSNNVFDPLESLSNDVGVIADSLISLATGKRTTAFDKSWASKAKRAGSLEGALKSYIQVGLDADVDGASSRYETGDSRTFKMTGNFVERLLSTWSKYENYALKTTDEFQKGGIQAETQRGIDQLKSKGKLEAEALPNWASETAKQRTFQNDGAIANAMVGARSAMNNISIKDSRGGSLGVGDVMLPFAKVPGNLVAQAANYSPLGLANSLREMTGVLIDAKKGNVSLEKQAQAARDFGRGVTGTGLLAGFAALAAKGLIDVAGDDDADKEALEKAQGRTGTQWNLSATVRAFKGESTEWQDDDTLLAIGFLDPINAIMAAGALLSDAYSEDGELTIKETADASLSSLVQAVLDLPAMSSISSLIDAYTYAEGETAGEKAANAAMEYAASQASSFLLPNALKGIATGTDDTVRNQYAGETWQEDAANSIKAGLPMLRETLPASLDSFGREKTYTGNSLLDFLNANLLPGTLTKYSETELEEEIERLNNETGATNIYPDKSAPTSVSYDNEKYTLTPEERYAYQQNFGQVAQDLMYSMAESSCYKSATDEEKAEMMNDTLSFAEDLAKREFLASRNVDYESSSWEKAYKVVDAGIDFSVYLEYKDQLSELKEASNTSTANSQIRRKIFSDSRLTQEQKSVLDETILSDGIYIPKDVNVDYSSDESFTITQMSESAQKRWPGIKEKFSITAEQYVEAWSIYNQDGVTAAEKKAALRELVGATQGNRLYTEFGKDLN